MNVFERVRGYVEKKETEEKNKQKQKSKTKKANTKEKNADLAGAAKYAPARVWVATRS